MNNFSQNHLLRSLVIIGLAIGLTACGGAPKKHDLEVRISASTDVNPNIDSRPSPVILHVFELASIDGFYSLEYSDLTQNEAAKLGGDKISKTQIILTPGDFKEISLQLDERVSYLGFVAGYRDIEHSKWRVDQEIIPGKTDWISVIVEKEQIKIEEVND